ncbi:MAG: AraC family transcriptional regulator, partial [Polyangiaceae bacterium]|nr:AraC family transcriptional regulator [Polyangiaceae bacterium]
DREPLVPVHYFENLADFSESRGGSRERLFRRAKLDLERAKAAGFVSFSEFRALMLAIAAETGSPSFALEFGCSISPASHGMLGLAVLASDDVRQALATLVRYVRTRTPLVHVDSRSRDGSVSVRVTDAIVLGDVQRSVHELVVSTIITALRALTSERFRATEIRFAFPAASADVPHERLLLSKVRFDASVTEVRFPASALSFAVVLADRTTARLATATLDEELAALEGRTDLRDRVRERLLRHRGALPSCAQVAHDLHTTERTLRRHLESLGTSYAAIREATRRELAVHYLRDTSLSVAEIAERLGYADPSNFGAAFRRWTGGSPRGFRKKKPRGE